MHFLSPSPKNKQTNKQKSSPQKNSLYFGKLNFLALVLKMFLYFLMFQEMETLKGFLWNMNLFRPPRQKKLHPEMDLSNSKIIKFLIFSGNETLHFSDQAQKNIYPGEISYASGNGNPEKFLIFSQKKAGLIFWEAELSYISRKAYLEPWYIQNPEIFRTLVYLEFISYILQNEAFLTNISESNFPSSESKMFLIFWEFKFFSPKPKNFLYLKREF